MIQEEEKPNGPAAAVVSNDASQKAHQNGVAGKAIRHGLKRFQLVKPYYTSTSKSHFVRAMRVSYYLVYGLGLEVIAYILG